MWKLRNNTLVKTFGNTEVHIECGDKEEPTLYKGYLAAKEIDRVFMEKGEKGVEEVFTRDLMHSCVCED